jgi:predicted flap endonuclease-1-like 5' DNA nuclease
MILKTGEGHEMYNDKGTMSCAVGCWLVALLAGVLAAVLLMVLGGWGFLQAAFMGVVLWGVAGVLVSLVMCRPLPPLGTAVGEAGKSQTAAAASSPAAKAEPAKAEPAKAAPAKAAPAKAAPAAVAPVKAAPEAPAPKPAAAEKPAAKKADLAPDGPGTKPETLKAARDGAPDDLKLIKGVGPKLEALLHSMGFYHFDQVAGWGADEVAWVDENLQGFKGRVSRDDWVEQAKTLAAGGSTEFSSKAKKGGA